jgi:hypothetical protein
MNKEYLKIYQDGKHDVSFYLFVLLVLINEQELAVLQKIYDEGDLSFIQAISILEEKGFIKWHGTRMEEISLRTKGEELFKSIHRESKSDVDSWIGEWRNIFPEGVNNLGYRYRGSKSECLKKMIKFVSANPFTREEIFEATKRYVQRFSARGYMYMEQAHYFIEKKERGSSLATECESLKEQQTLQTEEVNYGRTVI